MICVVKLNMSKTSILFGLILALSVFFEEADFQRFVNDRLTDDSQHVDELLDDLSVYDYLNRAFIRWLYSTGNDSKKHEENNRLSEKFNEQYDSRRTYNMPGILKRDEIDYANNRNTYSSITKKDYQLPGILKKWIRIPSPTKKYYPQFILKRLQSFAGKPMSQK